MVCVGLLGCSHTHLSAGGYFLMSLVIIVAILGLRIVLYSIGHCLQRCWHGESDDTESEDGHEVRHISNILALRHNQQPQQQGRATAVQPATPHEDWQSKLVISAGSDHVSYIARPCPFQTSTGQ